MEIGKLAAFRLKLGIMYEVSIARWIPIVLKPLTCFLIYNIKFSNTIVF